MSRSGASARMRCSHGCGSSPVTARRIARMRTQFGWLNSAAADAASERAGRCAIIWIRFSLPSISAGDRSRVVDDRGLRVENAALANPCLSLGVGFLPVRQKHDSLPAREAAHIDPRLVAVGDLVQVEVLVLFRREV